MGHYKNLAIEQTEKDRLLEMIRELGFDGGCFPDPTPQEIEAAGLIPIVEKAEEICSQCGNVGWTIEENSHGEYIEACFRCWANALDKEGAV